MKFKKGLKLAALIMLFATSPLLAAAQASARQGIYNLEATHVVDGGGFQPSVEPKAEVISIEHADEIAVGESTTVKVNIRYLGLGPSTELEAQIADDDTGSNLGYEDATLSGTGEYTFTLPLRATRTGEWHLVARVLWVATGNMIDHLHRFTIVVVEPSFQTVSFDFFITVDCDRTLVVSLRPGESDSQACVVGVGYSGNPPQEVSLTYTIPPVAGIEVSLSPLKATAPFASDLSVATTTQALPGTYTINIVGISGTLQRTATVTLIVTGAGGFDFSVKVDPNAVSLKPGQSATCTVSVAVVSGAAQEVSLTYTIPPVAGIGARISTTKRAPPFTSKLEISTTKQALPGTYTINVVGVSGSLQKIVTVTLTVTGAAGFDFSMVVSPDIVSLTPGETSSATVRVELVSGRAQEVSLMNTIPNVAGVAAGISPLKGLPPFTSILKIETTTQTPYGRYSITVTGLGGGVERQFTVILTVTEGPQPQPVSTDWAVGDIWMLPSNPKPGDQVIFSAKISALSSDKPFPQEVSVDVYLDRMLIGAGTALVPRKGVAVTVTAGTRWTTVVGSHTVAFEVDPADGVVYDDPDRENNRGELSFTVSATTQPPTSFDFSVTVGPESQSLIPEGSVVYDVYIDVTAGTSETVSLTLSGLPEDATYAFDPPTGLPYFPSRLTIYVPQYTAAGAPVPAGTYTLSVTAEGAGLIRTATTTLVIQAAEVTTTQLAQTSTQAALTSESTSVATTQAATKTAGTKGGLAEALGGAGIFLGLLIVVIVAVGAYYLGKRRKPKV